MSQSKNWALQLSTFLVITCCFAVMGSSLLVSNNLRRLLTLWGSDVQMTVYLSSDLNARGQQDLEAKLHALPSVGEIQFITQEHALTDFRKQLASYAPDVAKDDELLKMIPSSLQVSLSSSVPAAQQSQVMSELAAQVKEWEGVDEVNYGQDWIAKYSSLVTGLDVIIRLLGMIIVIASVLVMSNVIRAAIASRQDEIAVLELIGATSRMIRQPFLKEGAMLGGTSSAAALVICAGLFHLVKRLLNSQLAFLQLGQNIQFLTVISMILFVVGGAALGALGSYLCVRKVNHGWLASQGS